MQDLSVKFAQETKKILEDGELIFSEGDESREMYIVSEGEVEVTKKTNHGDIVLARLRKGDFVGEMSLLESLPRSATAKAKGRTKLVVIHPGGFLLKIRRDPTLAFEMLKELSRRIRVTNENLTRELNREQFSKDSLTLILNNSDFSAKSEKSA